LSESRGSDEVKIIDPEIEKIISKEKYNAKKH